MNTPDMLDVSEALTRLLSTFHHLSGEIIDVEKAAGRILARDIIAPFDLPLFSNSAMDGFAILSVDAQAASPKNPVRLKVVADIPAGTVFRARLQTGQAARIMTGSQIPEGCDAVIPVEFTDQIRGDLNKSIPEFVQIHQKVILGENIRKKGQDLVTGQRVFCEGQRLRPGDVGMLAMLGYEKVEVFRRPRVGILSGGDELITPGTPLMEGKIFESNSYTLMALAEELGAIPIRLGLASDTYDSVLKCLANAEKSQVDLIISSAGVSMGAYDYVRKVVEEKGELTFWKVNMRPGKPFLFGRINQLPIIGLPGNPVSSFVGFMVFVRPTILKMSGHTNLALPVIKAISQEEITSDGRESYLRGLFEISGEENHVRLTGHQGSGNHYSLTLANCLVLVPKDVKLIPPGATVSIIPM